MREKLHAAHPNRSGLFDVKHDRGGMIDIEFAVQYLVLAHAAPRIAELTANLGNIALLGMAADHGLIDAALAERCRDAYREFRRLQHALAAERRRLCARAARAGRRRGSSVWRRCSSLAAELTSLSSTVLDLGLRRYRARPASVSFSRAAAARRSARVLAR